LKLLIAALLFIAVTASAGTYSGVRIDGGSVDYPTGLYFIGDDNGDTFYTVDDITDVFARAIVDDGNGEIPNGCHFILDAREFTDVQIELPPCTTIFEGTDEFASLLSGPPQPELEVLVEGVPNQENEGILLAEPTAITRDGLILRNFSVDGKKQSLTRRPGIGHHNGIRIEDWASGTLSDVLIHNVHIRNTVDSAFYVLRTPNITIRDSSAINMGCWEMEDYNLDFPGTPLNLWAPPHDGGNLDMGCNGFGGTLRWPEDVQDYENNDIGSPGNLLLASLQRGRFTNGDGVECYTGTSGCTVTGMTVKGFTKIGIQVIDAASTEEIDLPNGGLFDNNTISYGNSSGIATVRSYNWTVSNNTISNMNTDWSVGNVGKGVGCSYAGYGNVYTGNTITNTGAQGLDVGCACGTDQFPGGTALSDCSLVVTDNVIDGTCEYYTAGTAAAIDLRPTFWGYNGEDPDDPYPTGTATVFGNTVTNNGCEAGLAFIRYDGLDASSGTANSIDGGTLFGFFATEANDISVDATDFKGSSPAAGTGVRLSNLTTNCTVTGVSSTGDPGYSTAVNDQCVNDVASDPYDLGTLPAIVSDIQWPAMPGDVTPLTTHTVCASGCDSTTIPWTTDNQRVEVSSGSYAGGTISCDNCHFVGATGATVNSYSTLNGAIVALDGWWLFEDGLNLLGGNASDVFMDNVKIETVTTPGLNWSGTPLDNIPVTRLAFINSTLDITGPDPANNFGVFVQAEDEADGTEFAGRDWIFANAEFIANVQLFRFQSTENFVMVDSAGGLDDNATNSMRFHHGMTDLYVRDTVMVDLIVGTSSTIDLINSEWDNVTRYVHGGHHEAWSYSNTPPNRSTSCIIHNSQVYSGVTSTGTPPIGNCTSPDGNPDTILWDEVTLPSPDGTGRPAPMTGIPYGADH